MFFRKPPLESAKNAIEKLSLIEQKSLGDWLNESADLQEILKATNIASNVKLESVQKLLDNHLKENVVLREQIEALKLSVEDLEKPLLNDRRVKELNRENRLLTDEQAQLKLELHFSEEKRKTLEIGISKLKTENEEINQENNTLAQENHQLMSQINSPRQTVLFDVKDDIVIVTSQSRKFHRANCQYLEEVAEKYKTRRKRSEAVNKGGRACRTCRP